MSLMEHKPIMSSDIKQDRTLWITTLGLTGRAPLLFNIASLCYDLSQHQATIELLNMYVRLDPKSGAAFLLLGRSYMALEQYEQAIRALEHANSLEPQSPDAAHLARRRWWREEYR